MRKIKIKTQEQEIVFFLNQLLSLKYTSDTPSVCISRFSQETKTWLSNVIEKNEEKTANSGLQILLTSLGAQLRLFKTISCPVSQVHHRRWQKPQKGDRRGSKGQRQALMHRTCELIRIWPQPRKENFYANSRGGKILIYKFCTFLTTLRRGLKIIWKILAQMKIFKRYYQRMKK